MRVHVLAPAKLNLGLEILGKRADGYHDIRTVFCAISIFDRVEIGHDLETTATFGEGDLAVQARDAFLTAASREDVVGLAVRKRIPVAAGMGGGSSDAAAVLAGMDTLFPGVDLMPIAAGLGSDVPFLLHGGLAIGAGRGEVLERLPFRALWFVVISLPQLIKEKTRAMFAALEPGDFSDGAEVGQTADRLRTGAVLRSRFRNTFTRALYHHLPDVGQLSAGIEQLVGLPVNVTGAGPSLFICATSLEHALSLRTAIQNQFPHESGMRLFCARSVSAVPVRVNPDE